jgi:hypothetical protein
MRNRFQTLLFQILLVTATLWQLAKTHNPNKKPGRGGGGIFRGTLGFKFLWPPPHPLPPAGAAVGGGPVHFQST